MFLFLGGYLLGESAMEESNDAPINYATWMATSNGSDGTLGLGLLRLQPTSQKNSDESAMEEKMQLRRQVTNFESGPKFVLFDIHT